MRIPRSNPIVETQRDPGLKPTMVSFLLAPLLAFLLLFTPAHCKDEKESVLKGINSYRQSQNLAVLAEADRASCLANEIADELEDVPCENVELYYPTASGIQKFPNFEKHVDKCGLDINSTREGVILPACVAKLEPTILLSNYTHNDRYASYLNNSLYTGVGLGSEGDWMVLVLTTNTPTGSFSAAPPPNFVMPFFIPALLLLLLMPMR
ncbi:uncharacterized GPI-anchored protein At3g06035-like [Prosopis cineraria]|uniref:uncharacterized GPI-anchored protein At3g06035-like n=1 Tax=Prosopis cineraria TaxID=364024 RepID=UPI00240F2828|nr:uncharacterized GPI-anchored protein At3g06035-like [Prosopis cineraria]